jgi:hypothetical protein
MFVMPFQVTDTEYSIYVGFTQDSMQRMMAYDPAELQLSKLPLDRFRELGLTLKDIVFGFCSEQDQEHAMKLMQEADDPRPGLQYLTRGFVFRPRMGDHDGPPLSIKPDPDKSVS